MTNVPDPPSGSVASYAQIMRRIVRDPGHPEAAALGLVQYLIGDSLLGPDEKLQRISNVVVAVSLLEAETAGPSPLLYSREADDPTPVSGARVEPHVGAVTDAGLVDETETYFKPGDRVVRKGGMRPGFPDTFCVTRVEPIEGTGETTPQRWQFLSAERPHWWLHCDEYVRVPD